MKTLHIFISHLSYLLVRSFSIWGRTVVQRSSFHSDLMIVINENHCWDMRSVNTVCPQERLELDSRLRVDDVEDVHHDGQVVHGDGSVQSALWTGDGIRSVPAL